MGFLTPLIFGLIAAAVTTMGLVLVSRRPVWTERHAGLFAAFAAGALASVSLLHLIPEAMALSSRAGLLMLAGLAGGFLLNRGVLALSERSGNGVLAAGLTPVLGIAFHSFIDGVAYAVTFSVSFATGLLATIGLVLHEFPEGVIVYALLRKSGLSNRAAFLWAFLAAAATTPFGALAAYPFVAVLEGPVLGDVFAVTAGLLLYIGVGHLLPHVERDRVRGGVLALFLGAAVAIATERIAPHSHTAPEGWHGDFGGHRPHFGHDHHGGDHDH